MKIFIEADTDNNKQPVLLDNRDTAVSNKQQRTTPITDNHLATPMNDNQLPYTRNDRERRLTSKSDNQRLNMELDLQTLFGIHVHSVTHWLRTLPPSPAFGLIYEDAIRQPR